MSELSLQEQFAKKSICYGCGPANKHGLNLKSYVSGSQVVGSFMPEEHHSAFPGVLNGGIIGTLLDCHCNWAACWYLMQKLGLDCPPCTVTAEYNIKLKRPTPVGVEIELVASLVEINGDRVTISGDLIASGKVCATCDGEFVRVGERHPAYHRW